MDLLVEKGDSRTYLSRYKVITTSFEESSPSVKRNNTQIQYRNGNVDFGGWHEAKKIDYVGYYRADDINEEETLREKIYALLSDPDGYYITQLKNDSDNSYERPGENTGDYFEKQVNRPSHKRFYVYASSLESELVGSYGGHVLYKISATFTTMKLPYGESVKRDLDIKPNVPYYGRNLLTGTKAVKTGVFKAGSQWISGSPINQLSVVGGKEYTYSISMITMGHTGHSSVSWLDANKNIISAQAGKDNPWAANGGRFTNTFTAPSNAAYANLIPWYFSQAYTSDTNISWNQEKFEVGTTASPWTPAPEDSEYNDWYTKIYYNTDNLVIPYAGTVTCNQLEQGFGVWFKSSVSASALDVYVNDVKFTYNGSVAVGDEFFLTGYEYGKNGTSIVKDTNKAYFKLFPNSINRISTSLQGKIIISGFQNLYA